MSKWRKKPGSPFPNKTPSARDGRLETGDARLESGDGDSKSVSASSREKDEVKAKIWMSEIRALHVRLILASRILPLVQTS